MVWLFNYKDFQKFSDNDNFLKNVEIFIIVVPFLIKNQFMTFQTPVATPHSGVGSPPGTPNLSNPAVEDTAEDSASSPQISSPNSLPDQNSNSVRDLENAMTKHLPKKKPCLQLPIPSTSSLEASNLIKQFYSRQSGYLDIDPENQFLNYARLGYPTAPAQPLPLKPNVYTMSGTVGATLEPAYTGFHDQTLYSHPSSFHLHNRGQTWYTGN